MLGFERQRNPEDFSTGSFALLEGELTNREILRFKRIRRNWNFYEGYHWEEFPEQDGPELTVNYCRSFVNKIVSFELGKAFTFTTKKELESKKVTPDGRTSFQFLEDVWEDNNQYLFGIEMGQMKSVTGEAWIQVRYVSPDDLNDPYGKYPDGRVQIMLMPTETIWPEFDPHDRKKLVRLTVMYTYKKITRSGILGRKRIEEVLYKQVWTDEECAVYDGVKSDPKVFPNKYGVIPFVCINNLTVSCRTEGYGDLDDIIPLNMEFNMKTSDVSEIIDYHAAPVTVVYGAKIGNLEKGANKMWGGLAKDARVENLELQGDLGASTNFINELKKSMCEVGGVPESVLGGAQSISNTSGVALQYMNLPLIEKCNQKRMSTEDGLERLNSLILLVSMLEGLIQKPDGVSTADFFFTDVDLPDTLPKDELIELQRIQLEMKLGLECRENAMRRIGKENITELLQKIDDDMEQHPMFYGVNPMQTTMPTDQHYPIPEVNSGIMNGSNPQELLRTEMTGRNGGAEVV